jgi:FlaG protein
MASDGQPVKISAVSLVHGSQAPTVRVLPSGNNLPQSGKAVAIPVATRQSTAAKSAAIPEPPAPVRNSAPEKQVAFLNKFLNDSGRPAQFRADPSSGDKVIQEINPANGEVIAEYSATEFAALARSIGISGALVDDHA